MKKPVGTVLKYLVLFMCTAVVWLAGCAALPEETKKELNDSLETLTKLKRETEYKFNGLDEDDGEPDENNGRYDEDDTGDELKLLALKAEELKALVQQVKEDETAAEILEEIEALKESYRSISEDLSKETDRRQDKSEEAEKHIQVMLHLRNLTDYRITGARYSEGSREGDELIPEGVSIGPGETLLGVTLEIYLPEKDRRLIFTDEAGERHEYSLDIDPENASTEGILLEITGDSVKEHTDD